VSYSDSQFGLNLTPATAVDSTARTEIKNLLNTLISNKVRDGDLDQSKLQSITAQLQNNIEAMTALIKAFSELNSALAQASPSLWGVFRSGPLCLI
jgi:urease accessory protein UreF